MSKERVEAITNLVKKVIEVNLLKGTKLAVDVMNGMVNIYDINNNCAGLLDGEEVPNRLYFEDEFWTNYFEATLERFYKKLEEY